jgi:hypothetical protein
MLGEQRQPTPWERRSELGPFNALWQTWKESIFHPDRFFSSVKPDGDVKDAVLYAWAVLAISLVPNVLMRGIGFAQLKESLQVVFKSTPEWMNKLSSFEWGVLVTVPSFILFPLTFFMGAGIVHVGCVLWSANKNGFRATARAMAYAQGLAFATSIPMIGGVLAIYVIVLLVIGVARLQGVHPGRATGAVLTPSVVLGCCLGMAISAFVVQMLAHR